MNQKVLNILNSNSPGEIKALFLFNKDDEAEIIRKKFLYWSRWFFPQFFDSADAPFHKTIDFGNIGIYVNKTPTKENSFLDIAYRNAAKTTRTKLFIAFAIANDEGHYRKYFKVLSKEFSNAAQSTTDVYNMLVSRRIRATP